MLTADQIDALRDRAGEIADPILRYLLEDIARRVAEAGQLTSTASYQVWRAQQLGLSQKEIKKRLQELLNTSGAEIEKLMTQSAEVGYSFDLKHLPTAAAIPFEKNAAMQKLVSAAVKLAQEDFTNLTQTLGMVDPYGHVLPLQDAYRQCMDYAFQQVFTGATDYNTAIRQATRNLADKGVRVIDYESGVHTSLEAAARRNIMGGLGLMQEQISQQNHDEMEANGWEISAHAASAPDHEPIQGRQYSDEAFKRLNGSLKRRIGTLNCGHAVFPIILGVSEPQYTPAELEAMRQQNAKGVTIEGRHYSLYEATQMQRKMERSIRKQKKRILVDKATGDEEKLQIDQTKLRMQNTNYKRFSDAAGLRTQRERTFVAGVGKKEAAASWAPSGNTKPEANIPTVPNASKNTVENKPQLIQGFVSGEKGSVKSAFTKAEERGTIALTSEEEYAVSKYVGKDSYIVNESLRSGEPLSSDEQQFVSNLDKALEKVPTYTGTVHRSLSSQAMRDPEGFWNRYIPGQRVVEMAYTSTSTEVYDDTMDIQMIIQCKNGRDLRAYNPNEQEILLQRGTTFLVEKREGNTIWLTEI